MNATVLRQMSDSPTAGSREIGAQFAPVCRFASALVCAAELDRHVEIRRTAADMADRLPMSGPGLAGSIARIRVDRRAIRACRRTF